MKAKTSVHPNIWIHIIRIKVIIATVAITLIHDRTRILLVPLHPTHMHTSCRSRALLHAYISTDWDTGQASTHPLANEYSANLLDTTLGVDRFDESLYTSLASLVVARSSVSHMPDSSLDIGMVAKSDVILALVRGLAP
jgi:hypothetical protein